MPRSPVRTSTGSPGTSRIAMNVTNISAKNVGSVSAMRRARYCSIDVRGSSSGCKRSGYWPAPHFARWREDDLLQIDAEEMVPTEWRDFPVHDLGPHRFIDHRMCDRHIGSILFH